MIIVLLNIVSDKKGNGGIMPFRHVSPLSFIMFDAYLRVIRNVFTSLPSFTFTI